MDLENPDFDYTPPVDRRPMIYVPPAVKLLAVEDVTLAGKVNDVEALSAFYIDLLKFERDEKEPGLTFCAENVRLRVDLVEAPILREDLRALGVEVPSLAQVEKQLIAQQIPYDRERGIELGRVTFLLQDPSGNWIRLSESRRLM